MEVKCLEIRDAGTFLPVICIRPVADNEAQRWLLRCDGYSANKHEQCIIMIDAQCRGVSYDPYSWPRSSRTKKLAHQFIEEHWHALKDGDVIDVEFILGETEAPKMSERETVQGVEVVSLENPADVHSAIARAVGEPEG